MEIRWYKADTKQHKFDMCCRNCFFKWQLFIENVYLHCKSALLVKRVTRKVIDYTQSFRYSAFKKICSLATPHFIDSSFYTLQLRNSAF